jgi:hypothetical protein
LAASSERTHRDDFKDLVKEQLRLHHVLDDNIAKIDMEDDEVRSYRMSPSQSIYMRMSFGHFSARFGCGVVVHSARGKHRGDFDSLRTTTGIDYRET